MYNLGSMKIKSHLFWPYESEKNKSELKKRDENVLLTNETRPVILG